MKIKTNWDLAKLYYKSLSDPRIARDIAKGDKAVDVFVAAYSKNKKWLTDPKALGQALADYERLSINCPASPLYYASYRKELNAKDKDAEAFLNKWSDHFTKRGNKLLFFELQLGKISAATQKKMLAAPELKGLRYWLTKLFETAKHNLAEPEEKILSLLSDVSSGRWVTMVDNMLSNQMVPFKGKKLPLNEATERVALLPLKDRRALHSAIMLKLKEVADAAEAELNALCARKKTLDELRGFKEPYDATIMGYENDRDSVLALVKAVTQNFKLSHRFYKIKARMMGLKSLTYADRTTPVGRVAKKIPFSEAVQIVGAAFYGLHPRYKEIFDRLVADHRVDVYPKAGKSGGAFCSSGEGEPTMVLLNHVDDVKSLLTIAHEMGHAVHAERSKSQRPMYEGHTIATAEVASTFFEQAAFEALTRNLSKKERLVALHDRLQDDVSGVFRQIACFNFQVEMHAKIRQQGLLDKVQLAELMNRHMGAYLGKSVALVPEDGYFFVRWSHLRRFFYVYTYAYGQLVSRALLERVKKDPKFIDQVDEFLSAGGSDSCEEIFAKCGLNLYKPDIFIEGLRGIEKDLKELEKAVN